MGKHQKFNIRYKKEKLNQPANIKFKKLRKNLSQTENLRCFVNRGGKNLLDLLQNNSAWESGNYVLVNIITYSGRDVYV